MRFDRSFLAISTAVNGLGIALESTRLAEREIDSGLLVPAVGQRTVDVRYVGHYLVFPRIALRRQPLQIFLYWIARELKLDMESTLKLPIYDAAHSERRSGLSSGS